MGAPYIYDISRLRVNEPSFSNSTVSGIDNTVNVTCMQLFRLGSPYPRIAPRVYAEVVNS